MKYTKLFEQFLEESETIGLKNIEANNVPNPVQAGEGEDERLVKIRQYKGTVQDYKEYWDDRINTGNS